MFCTVDRRNKAPLIYKIVVSLRSSPSYNTHNRDDFFSLGKNSIVSSNNKISFHTKGRIRIDTRIHIYIFLNIVTIILFLSTRTRIGQGSGSAMNLAYRPDNPAFLATQIQHESQGVISLSSVERNHRFPGNLMMIASQKQHRFFEITTSIISKGRSFEYNYDSF